MQNVRPNNRNEMRDTYSNLKKVRPYNWGEMNPTYTNLYQCFHKCAQRTKNARETFLMNLHFIGICARRYHLLDLLQIRDNSLNCRVLAMHLVQWETAGVLDSGSN